jgi:hypothetical protein
LIKVHATTINAGYCEMRGLKAPLMFSLSMRIFNGFKTPKRITVLSQDFAGEIEQVGKSGLWSHRFRFGNIFLIHLS